PLLSRERFLEYCEAFLEENELFFLQNLALAAPEKIPEGDSCEAAFLRFETALRNALASVRAKAKGVKGDRFLHREDDGSSSLNAESVIVLLQNAPHPLERERLLDKARWDALEELEFAHYADLDALGIYCRKLLILEKWERYRADKADKDLEETVSAVEGTAWNF
ncbi:MAG: DUF2764 family protein, partial [Lentisphaeria bacterium]|nr:DUF2764 family protein [Lentisphaeria bacterium]